MKKSLIWLLAGGLGTTGLLVTSLAIADGRGHKGWGKDGVNLEQVEKQMIERFKTLDSDGDGSLSLAEFSGCRLEQMKQLDANKDGVLSRDEMPKFGKGKGKKRHGHGKGDDHSHGSLS